MMAIANVIVGNSSSGIIEAASFHLPAVDVGIRQLGRILPANVLRTSHNQKEIVKAVETANSKGFRRKIGKLKNPYGDGHAAQRIAAILAEVRPTAELLQKRLKVA
jgi:UDP-N-acetylglucosamine 2-epimerase (non-hydrolysing)/GDP/UDP-N,N'-diacetylbacillosamine 2-epimerase (hydrolysing)